MKDVRSRVSTAISLCTILLAVVVGVDGLGEANIIEFLGYANSLFFILPVIASILWFFGRYHNDSNVAAKWAMVALVTSYLSIVFALYGMVMSSV